AVHQTEVVATGACRQPQLVQWRLRIDDDLAAAREHQFEQAASALAVDVDLVVLEPAVERGLDGRQHPLRARVKLAVAQRRRAARLVPSRGAGMRSGCRHGRYNRSMVRSPDSVASPTAETAPMVPFTLLRTLALLLACGLVAACGQKGPLTLPKGAA